ncbi:MAG: hypothetical protein AAGI38_22520 [Bacteroidota bacterium]
MEKLNANSGSPQNHKILLASCTLLIMIHIKEYTWGWLGSPLFWVIAFLLMLSCAALIGWLLFDLYKWMKNGFPERHQIWTYLMIIGILAISIDGMR